MKKHFLLLYLALCAGNCIHAQAGNCNHGHICCDVTCPCCPESSRSMHYLVHPGKAGLALGGIETLNDTLYSTHGNTRMLTCITKYVNHTPDIRSMPPFTPEGSITYIFIKNNSADTLIYHSLNPANYAFEFTRGTKAKPTEYYTDFKTGKALVTDSAGAYFLINHAGEQLPIPWQTTVPLGNGLQKVSIIVDYYQLYALADKKGRQLGALQYQYMENPVNGLMVVSKSTSPYGPFGLMDTTGKIIVPMIYQSIRVDGGACVVSMGESDFNGPHKFGIIDNTGRELIPCRYDYIGPFSEGLATAQLDGKWGYLNAKGEKAIDFKYDQVQPFTNGLGAVAVNGQYGFIDKKGDIQIPLKFKRVSPFRDGLAIAFTSLNRDTCGMIDTKGNWAIPPVYFDIHPFKDGLTIAYKPGEGPRMIDKQNRIQYPGYIIEDNMYLTDSYFADSVALFHKTGTGQVLLVNKTGKIILDPQTPEVEFLLDQDTKTVLPYLKVRKGYKWGIMDFTGKMVVECEYTEMRHFVNGWLPVWSNRDRNNLWGLIDKNFNESLTHKFVHIEEHTGNGLIKVQENYNNVFINSKGERLKPLASW